MNLNPNILIEVVSGITVGAIVVTGPGVVDAQPSKLAFYVTRQFLIPYSINSFFSCEIIFLYQIKYILPVYIYVAIAGKESL